MTRTEKNTPGIALEPHSDKSFSNEHENNDTRGEIISSGGSENQGSAKPRPEQEKTLGFSQVEDPIPELNPGHENSVF